MQEVEVHPCARPEDRVGSELTHLQRSEDALECGESKL